MILTRKEYADFEKRYWQTSTNIGFIFSLGVMMGFVVGIVIVYQILYTDVADHLAEYATLKAMGYRDVYLLIIVFQEALLLSVLGFFPGGAISLGLYALVRKSIALPMVMTVERAALVLSFKPSLKAHSFLTAPRLKEAVFQESAPKNIMSPALAFNSFII